MALKISISMTDEKIEIPTIETFIDTIFVAVEENF